MERHKIGYYISKGKCLNAYAKKKLNKRTKRVQIKKVNSKGKLIKKGTKIYKKKSDCLKKIKKTKAKKTKAKSTKAKKQPKRKVRKERNSRFGEVCAYSVPYFGSMVPSVSKFTSGTPNTGRSSIAWAWPTPPSALGLDKQQGGWLKARNIN